jgi:hypothetical protein
MHDAGARVQSHIEIPIVRDSRASALAVRFCGMPAYSARGAPGRLVLIFSHLGNSPAGRPWGAAREPCQSLVVFLEFLFNY